MYLKSASNGDAVEVLDVAALIDPFKNQIEGRFHAGEEMQDPSQFDKAGLIFPSGEALPRCWIDPDYH